MFGTIFSLSVIALVLALIRRYREIFRKHALSKNIPGLPALPVFGNAFQLPRSGPEELRFAIRMREKYGETFKLWIGGALIIFIYDPHDVEVVLRSSKEIRKSSAYKSLHKWLGTGLLTSTGEKWLSRRKAITPTFHFSVLEQFTEVFNRKSTELVDALTQFESPAELDAEKFVARYTMDVLCETAMGFELGGTENSLSEYISSIRKMCDIIGNRYLKPIFLFEPLWALFGERAAEMRTLKTINRLTEKMIKEREREILQSEKEFLQSKSGTKIKPALLEKLIRQKLSGNPSLKTYDGISEEVNTFLFEGHDTTTSGLSFALDMLARHPNVQENVYNEIMEIMGDETYWSIQDLQKLTYLERVIKETLRLYPSVPVIGRKLNNDTKLPSGYVLPADCTVTINLYLHHRNENYFKNAEEFNPDNFLPQATVKRHPYAYIPFSAGPRNCIGQKYAMLGMKTALGKIVRHFKLSVPASSEQKPIVPLASLVLRAPEGHWVVFNKREAS